MKNTKKPYKKGLQVVTGTDAAPENPPENPPAQADEAPAAAPPMTAKEKRADRHKAEMGFWEHVASIPKERYENKQVYIYLYMLEPFANIKTEGEAGYLAKYFEVIDADFIMRRWGSGKYFARLKERTNVGARTDRDLNRIEFSIINPQYPPKVQREMWEDDPRNAKWVAMLPPKQSGQDGKIGEHFNTFMELRRDIKEEIQADRPEQPKPVEPAAGLESLVNAASKIVEMTKPKEAPAAQTQVDPWAAAERILNMRSDNPMVDLWKEELKSIREELKEERTESRRLQTELFKIKTGGAEGEASGSSKPKTLIEQVKEAKEVLTQLGVPLGENGGGGRATKMSGWEFAQNVITGIANAPIMNALAQRLVSPPPVLNGRAPIQPNGAPGQQPPPQQPAPKDFLRFVNETVAPAMISYLEADSGGKAFADWLFAGFPEEAKELQTITHPSMPGQKGEPVIIAFYKSSPHWARIQYHQARFEKFVKDFCEFKPEGEEPQAPAGETGESEKPERVEV